MALGASSPFWFGLDSGLASARSAMVRGYPGRGAPPPLRTWEDYLEQLDAIAAGGGPTDRTMVWWDVRLQPRLGTVELRELDVQTRLEDAAALAALVRACQTGRRAAGGRAVSGAGDSLVVVSCLSRRLAGDDRPRGPAGVGARGRPGDGCRLGPHEPALEGVERILAEGNGADRQRAAFRHGGMRGFAVPGRGDGPAGRRRVQCRLERRGPGCLSGRALAVTS